MGERERQTGRQTEREGGGGVLRVGVLGWSRPVDLTGSRPEEQA